MQIDLAFFDDDTLLARGAIVPRPSRRSHLKALPVCALTLSANLKSLHVQFPYAALRVVGSCIKQRFVLAYITLKIGSPSVLVTSTRWCFGVMHSATSACRTHVEKINIRVSQQLG